jgi:hypothetical protein
LAVLAIQPCVRGIDGVPRGPDIEDLFLRASGSVYVVKGRVLESKGAGGRSWPVSTVTDEKQLDEIIKNSPGIDEKRMRELFKNGPLVRMESDPGGTLYTVAVDQVICRQGDFSATSSVLTPPAGPIHMFVPFQERTTRSKLDTRRFVESEYLASDAQYLLFLRAGPPGAELSARYGLDPSLSYYRAYEGKRGAVRLPDAANPEQPYEFVTPLVSAVTAFCEAVKAPDVETKIRSLNAVKDHSTDPAWRQSVDAAINALQRAQTKPPQPQ